MASRLAALGAALVAVLAVAGSAAPAKPPSSVDRIKKGLVKAVASGQLDQPTASGYAAVADRATALLPKLSPSRAQTLKGMLEDIAGQTDAFDQQWGLTLFSMLELNEQLLLSAPLPRSGTDVY